MQEIKKFTRKDVLLLLHNQILQELIAAELNAKIFERKEMLSVEINPDLTSNVTRWRNQVRTLKETYETVSNMLKLQEEEGSKIN